ncbi:MAG: hypothetical protein KGK08_07685 [Acidobacteriota bacterium]|nr:hypothetical protein [Acidobacteriota bacterium]
MRRTTHTWVAAGCLTISAVISAVACAVATAQQPAAPATSAPATAATAPSAVIKPGLDSLQEAIGELRIERWKAPSAMRDEMTANVSSIQRDVQGALPGLMTAADAAPDSAAALLPLCRNLGALYDVVLRLDAVARLSATASQVQALDQALAKLEDGRRVLLDSAQGAAQSREKQVTDLKAALKAATTPPPAPAAPVVSAAPPVVNKSRKKPVAKPAAKPAGTTTPAATSPATSKPAPTPQK